MKILNAIKDLFSKLFKGNTNNELDFMIEEKPVKQLPEPETNKPIELPEGEIVPFLDEVLDTNSRIAKEIFNHNLDILINNAKEKGKVDKFMLIREDDIFPTDWEWRVSSKNTTLEKVCTTLSYELKKVYALEQCKIEPYKEVMGMKLPLTTQEKEQEALKYVDKNLGFVSLPSVFRSTKHFTVNTPLSNTGDYNTTLNANRDFIIIDNINAFLESEYAYSVSYHDAYLDVSHESLPISQEAVVLIDDEKYERIMSDEKIASELAKRKVIRFNGEEDVAIKMILTQMGALPYNMGTRYDNETYDILKESIKDLAKENDLLFDKNHGGELEEGNGHFSHYYDIKNKDYEKAVGDFMLFLKQKFPEYEDLFPEYLSGCTYRVVKDLALKAVSEIETAKLLDAINEYNELADNKKNKLFEEYKQDRKSITPEIHTKFVETITLINDFYKNIPSYKTYEERSLIENAIQAFFQGETVSAQVEAAESVKELLIARNINKTENTIKEEAISMRKIVENAITNGTTIEDVAISDNIELNETLNMQKVGETIDDN